MVAQNEALQRDLEEARIAAVTARITQHIGAIGSIDVGPFDLPNPGGGANLIDGCAFTLEPGRRCVPLTNRCYLQLYIVRNERVNDVIVSNPPSSWSVNMLITP